MNISLSAFCLSIWLLPVLLLAQVTQRPGVYTQQVTSAPPTISSVETRIPIFIGYTQKLPKNAKKASFSPRLVSSYADYTRNFGGKIPGFFLAQSIRLFFENGGGKCYVLSVGIGQQAPQKKMLTLGLQKSLNAEAQLLLIPDAVQLSAGDTYALQREMLRLCARKEDRFAILSTRQPTSNATGDFQDFRSNTSAANLSWGAVYYPWLLTQSGEAVPPEGAIAGLYAKTDTKEGVWKAPANVQVAGINGLSQLLSQGERSAAASSPSDGKSINPIATFTGQGILVWGSRTLAGNDNEWRYVPVRRLSILLEQSLRSGLNWAVFEGNDATLWASVEMVVSDYLIRLWRKGAFAGDTPKKAFFVKCGQGKTMTTQDVQDGKLIVEIGFAPLQPAEFVIMRLEWKMP